MGIGPQTSVQELLDIVCVKCQLNPAVYFLRLRGSEQEGCKILDKSHVIIEEVGFLATSVLVIISHLLLHYFLFDFDFAISHLHFKVQLNSCKNSYLFVNYI